MFNKYSAIIVCPSSVSNFNPIGQMNKMTTYPPNTFKRAILIAAAGTVIFLLILMLFFTEGLKANPAFDPGNITEMNAEQKTALMSEFMIDMTGTEVLVHHIKNPELIAEQVNLLLTVFALLFLSSVVTSRLYVKLEDKTK